MEGRQIMYRGEWYRIRLCMDKNRRRARVWLAEQEMLIATPSRDEKLLQEAVERWLVRQAHMIIPVRVMHYQQMTGGEVNEIHIKNQKTRWGSCSSKRNLNFNWYLVMAPPEVLDYVVVHELCHLTHMNHGSEFWKLVESVMPEYDRMRKWLLENGGKLTTRGCWYNE